MRGSKAKEGTRDIRSKNTNKLSTEQLVQLLLQFGQILLLRLIDFLIFRLRESLQFK